MVNKLALAVSVTLAVASVTAARADDAKPWETFHAEMGPVPESSATNRVRITSACAEDLEYRYWVGRSSPGASRGTGPEYDARGPAAAPGADFREASGSITVSKSKPVVLDVALLPDQVYEGPEHVTILFEGFTVAATFVGDVANCAQDHVTTEQFELAFTIEDDDPAPAPGVAAGGSAQGKPGPKTSGGPVKSQVAPSDGDTVALVERAAGSLPEAAGVSLVGAEAQLPHRGRGSPSAPYGAGVAVTLSLLGFVAARMRARAW